MLPAWRDPLVIGGRERVDGEKRPAPRWMKRALDLDDKARRATAWVAVLLGFPADGAAQEPARVLCSPLAAGTMTWQRGAVSGTRRFWT